MPWLFIQNCSGTIPTSITENLRCLHLFVVVPDHVTTTESELAKHLFESLDPFHICLQYLIELRCDIYSRILSGNNREQQMTGPSLDCLLLRGSSHILIVAASSTAGISSL